MNRKDQSRLKKWFRIELEESRRLSYLNNKETDFSGRGLATDCIPKAEGRSLGEVATVSDRPGLRSWGKELTK